ncbi:MAG TPA: HNH endonuclease, partial [Mycobacterium sp.]|nr:HNH endonuclease [Mycobacterium sp.]
WTSPSGQTYTTKPGSAILFPSLCRPTAPIVTSTDTSAAAASTATQPSRDLAMPRRKTTRTQNRHRAIETERQLNNAYIAERNKPPPF